MKESLEQQLYDSFPHIFPLSSTSRRYGCSIDDGWYKLLYSACELIQNHIVQSRIFRASALQYNRALTRALRGDSAGLEWFYSVNGHLSEYARTCISRDLKEKKFKEVPVACPQLVATQIKEKFGTLRFYYSGGDSVTRGIVAMTEHMSSHICSVCGNKGTLEASTGWLSTLCDADRRSNSK